MSGFGREGGEVREPRGGGGEGEGGKEGGRGGEEGEGGGREREGVRGREKENKIGVSTLLYLRYVKGGFVRASFAPI